MSNRQLAIKGTAFERREVDGPTVSVVMATYNRPDVLAAAIRSVLAQDLGDWELIVVGDHCEEATGHTILGFGDPRIHYINLAVNTGDQSGPNNVGTARARGRYIAFLNHDDFWFPDHLRGAVDWLEAAGADLVIARSASVIPAEADPDRGGDWWVAMHGIGRRRRYDPVLTVGPASSLLFKAEVVTKAGPWRPAIDCHLASSQEWLFRVWRSGAVMRTWPHLTVLSISSGTRAGSYRQASPEHARFEALLRSPTDLRLLLLDPVRQRRFRWKGRVLRRLAPILRGLARLGIPPTELLGRLGYGYGRGAWINRLHHIRGLERIAREEPSSEDLRDRYSRDRAAEDGIDPPKPRE